MDFKDRIHTYIVDHFGDTEMADRVRSLLAAKETAAKIAHG